MYSEKKFLLSIYFGFLGVETILIVLFVLFSHLPFWIIPIFVVTAIIGNLIGVSILKRVLPLFFGTTFTKSEELVKEPKPQILKDEQRRKYYKIVGIISLALLLVLVSINVWVYSLPFWVIPLSVLGTIIVYFISVFILKRLMRLFIRRCSP